MKPCKTKKRNIELIAVVRPYAKDISRKKFEAQWQKTFQHIIHPKRKQKEKKYTKTL